MIKGAKAYLKTQVNTTSQGDLLIMLYTGAIKYLQQAKEHIDAKDFAQKGILISKAMDVIAELDQSLNAEKGGEVAQNLHQLYFYCSTRLLKANMKMDKDIIDEIIRILEGLREAFMEIQGQKIAAAKSEAAKPMNQAPAEEAEAPAPPKAKPAKPFQKNKFSHVTPFPTIPGMPGQPAAPKEDVSKGEQPQEEKSTVSPAPPIGGPAIPGLYPSAQAPSKKPAKPRGTRKGMPGTYGPSGTIK